MDLSPYLDSVRSGVRNAASLADEHTQQVAERLGGAIDASARLALINALSDAAGTISAEIAPSSVELRMAGQEPEFVVAISPADGIPTVLRPAAAEPPGAEEAGSDPGDEPVARISLRLPPSVKARVDEVAAKDGVSTNTWLVRAVTDALAWRGEGSGEWPQPPRPPAPPFAGAIFGPHGPFGAHGVFGPHGPFGLFGDSSRPAEPRPPESGSEPHPAGPGHRARGNVQGWVQ